MSAKEKVIGFKVSEESNLLQRLKMVVRRTGKSYGELLEGWIVSEEAKFGTPLFGQSGKTVVPTSPPPDFEARLGVMEKTIAELTAKLKEQKSAPVQPIERMAARPEISSEESKPRKPAPKTASEQELKNYEIRIIELSKLTNEAGKKLSTRAIAERLEAEGVLSEKGKLKWSSGNVSDHQKKLRDRGLIDS
jgi:hypothetical protein